MLGGAGNLEARRCWLRLERVMEWLEMAALISVVNKSSLLPGETVMAVVNSVENIQPAKL